MSVHLLIRGSNVALDEERHSHQATKNALDRARLMLESYRRNDLDDSEFKPFTELTFHTVGGKISVNVEDVIAVVSTTPVTPVVADVDEDEDDDDEDEEDE